MRGQSKAYRCFVLSALVCAAVVDGIFGRYSLTKSDIDRSFFYIGIFALTLSALTVFLAADYYRRNLARRDV